MKLVRDRIPEIINSNGKSCVWRAAKKEEVSSLLNQKLLEEVQEYIQSENAEELADIAEVIHAIAQQKQKSWADIDSIRIKKRQERGGFDKGIVLESWDK